MAYKESLLQWVWQELQFNCSDLQTTCGKKIEIYDNGIRNNGAGPDFSGAHLFIDGLVWHGSVEIHNTAEEWFRHGHQHDQNFNNVVLHVVGSDKELCTAETENGSKLFTLCLEPYLQKGLYELLQYSKKGSLPCAGNIDFIHQKAFEEQVEAAHKEYFEYKVNELVQFYPAGIPISRAWKLAFIHQVYRTFGVSANRDQMGELAKRLSVEECGLYSLEEWQKRVWNRAFRPEKPVEKIPWVKSGIRPSGFPEERVRQAAAFHYAAARLSTADYLRGPVHSWESIMNCIPSGSEAGKMMNRLVHYTAFLPASYLLGKLLHDVTLMNRCYACWIEQDAFVPATIQATFREAGFQVSKGIKKLGLAHQYKRYCSQKNCRQCKVFKNAIRA
jgi:hypothetical protein